MGTDIYAWLEGRDSKGKWHTINPRFVSLRNMDKLLPVSYYEIGRSYLLFSALANIRNENAIPFISEPRGIPSDISPELAEKIEDEWSSGRDCFFSSRVMAKELKEYADQHRKSDNEFLSQAAIETSWLYSKIWNLSFEIQDEITGANLQTDDIRIVFWFDS